MSTFHYPTASTVTRLGFQVAGFLATRFDVGHIVSPAKVAASIVRIIPLVQAKMLSLAIGWFRAPNRPAIESSLQESDIMGIGTTNFHTQRNAAPVGQHRPLGAQFASIGRVFSGFFPHPVATWSSHRLRFAIPIECPSTRRIRASIVSIACERRPTRSIPGNSCATNCRNRILGEPLSTDPRPQDIENTVGNLTQWQPRLAPFGTGGVLWQQWLHPLPKFIGQTPCAPVLLL